MGIHVLVDVAPVLERPALRQEVEAPVGVLLDAPSVAHVTDVLADRADPVHPHLLRRRAGGRLTGSAPWPRPQARPPLLRRLAGSSPANTLDGRDGDRPVVGELPYLPPG